MPINITGAGRSYSMLVNSFTNAASGTVISPADANTAHADLATALDTALDFAPIEGQRRVMGIQASAATPPVSPADGQVWLVATGGTGAFAGKDRKYAVYLSASWTFFDPLPGDTAIVVATRQSFIYDASGVWQAGNALAGANSNISSLSGLTTPLSVAQGGTAGNTAATARAGIAAAASGANSDITSLSGLTTPLSLGQGGTAGTNAPTARAGIGAAASGANTDITSLGGLTTPLAVAQGGTGANTVAGATAALNVFTSATKGLVPASGGGSTAFLRADGVFAAPNAGAVLAMSSTGTLGAADVGKVVVLSGGSAFTVNLAAAATLGNGWFVKLVGTGTGIVTIDPSGSETVFVNGGLVLAMTLAKGQECELICDGSSTFYVRGYENEVILSAVTVSGGSSIDLVFSPGYEMFELVVQDLTVGNNSTAILLRLSTDNGATFISSANAYGRGTIALTSNASVGGGASGGAEVVLGSGLGNAMNAGGAIKIYSPFNPSIMTHMNSYFDFEQIGVAYNPALAYGRRLLAEVNNAVRILPGSGTISGKVLLRGTRY